MTILRQLSFAHIVRNYVFAGYPGIAGIRCFAPLGMHKGDARALRRGLNRELDGPAPDAAVPTLRLSRDHVRSVLPRRSPSRMLRLRCLGRVPGGGEERRFSRS